MKEIQIPQTQKDYSAPVILYEGVLEIQAGSPLRLFESLDSEELE